MSVSGKSYEFCKTSQNNELAEETGVEFDHSTSSFRSEIFLDIFRYILFSEKFVKLQLKLSDAGNVGLFVNSYVICFSIVWR